VEVGIALPQMAVGYGPRTTADWARGADAGPFSSISAGERVTFSNPEMVASLAAAAALTERVRILANLWVLPQHPMAMVAQQIGTLDQLSNGRLEVAVGVGGREHDYQALGAPFEARHRVLDDKVGELRQLLSGQPPFEGGDSVGPACVQPGGPRLLAGAMGPKSLARAAQWADGVSGFSIGADIAEIERGNRKAVAAWEAAGRSSRPRLVSGCFVCVGVDDSEPLLHAFTARYLGFLGTDLAEAVASTAQVNSEDALARALDGAAAAGCDEFILVPATPDLRCLEVAAKVVASR